MNARNLIDRAVQGAPAKKLVSEAMGEDFSWEPAVKKYETLYDGAQKKRAKR